jgi:hypothetical protein
MNKCLALILLLAYLLSASPAHAALDSQGQIALFGTSMPTQNLPDVTQNTGGIDARIKERYSFNRQFHLSFEPWFRADGLTRSPEERSYFEPHELSLEWKKSAHKIKIGFSTESWEGTDLFNPMSFLHAKNWRDPLNSENRSSPGVFYSDQIAQFSWDLVYIPWQSKAVLPGDNSPWWPRQFNLPVQNPNQVLLLPLQAAYRLQSDEILNHALDNNIGLRIGYHGSRFDLSLAGYQGSASPPLLTPIVNLTPVEVSPQQIYQLQSPILIQPTYYRQQLIAGALIVPMGTWILHLADQYSQSLGDDPRLPGWLHYGVLELEKTWSIRGQSLVSFIELIASKRPDSTSFSSVSSLTERSVALGFRWPFTENWTWTSGAFQEEKSKSAFVHSALAWNFRENWREELAGDLFLGPPDSTLGNYTHNDRIQEQITYSF